MSKKIIIKNTGATGIIEKAIHFLRMSSVEILFSYYLGSLPFVLGFLYFWSDMSRSAFAYEYCPEASLILTLLFIWMKCWQSAFTIKVYENLSYTKISSWSLPAVIRLVATQTIIQASGFFILPVALLITMPYPWVFAFYQNVLVQDYRKKTSIRIITGKTASFTNFHNKQNFKIISILTFFQIFILLNIAIAIYSIPFLLKILFGIESIVTMGGFSYFNSTFIISAFGITYLCVDPIIKTVYTLRLLCAESEKTGADLKAGLKKILNTTGKMTLTFCLLLPLFIAPELSFSNENLNLITLQDKTVNPESLDKSIDNILSRREFAWKMPDQKTTKKKARGFITDIIDWLKPYFKSFFKTLTRWAKKIAEWFKKLMPTPKPYEKNSEKKSGFVPRYMLCFLLIITCGFLLFFLAKLFVFRKKTADDKNSIENSIPDIRDENIKADDMLPDQWLNLAFSLADKGEFRLAIRALYLGTLSRLAENKLIIIKRSKSNREYELDLSRRAHEKKEMLSIFGESVSIFEKVWYGSYGVTKEDVDLFAKNQVRIVNFE